MGPRACGGSTARSPRLAAGEGTLETALDVKSSLCSGDITHGCHGNVSHGEGVIGERSGAGMLRSFWSCANLHGGGRIRPISPSCVRGVLPPSSPRPWQRGRGTPSPSARSSRGSCLGRAVRRVG